METIEVWIPKHEATAYLNESKRPSKFWTSPPKEMERETLVKMDIPIAKYREWSKGGGDKQLLLG